MVEVVVARGSSKRHRRTPTRRFGVRRETKLADILLLAHLPTLRNRFGADDSFVLPGGTKKDRDEKTSHRSHSLKGILYHACSKHCLWPIGGAAAGEPS